MYQRVSRKLFARTEKIYNLVIETLNLEWLIEYYVEDKCIHHIYIIIRY